MYAILGKDQTGIVKVTYGVAGGNQPLALEELITGPFEGQHSFPTNPAGPLVWGSCGVTSDILVASFEVRVQPAGPGSSDYGSISIPVGLFVALV
jgi:hypothetical protein